MSLLTRFKAHRIDFARLFTGAPGFYLTGFGFKRLEGSASVSERRGHLVDFLTKFSGSRVRESIYVYIILVHLLCDRLQKTQGLF